MAGNMEPMQMFFFVTMTSVSTRRTSVAYSHRSSGWHPDREFEGSGLGLTIAKSASEKNAGRGLGGVVHRYGRDLLFRTAQLLGARIRVNSGCTVPGTYEQSQLSSVRR